MAPTRRLRRRASVAQSIAIAIAVGLVLTASPATADDSTTPTPPAAAAEQPSEPAVDQPAAPTPPQQDATVAAVLDTRLPLREGAVGPRVRVAQKRLQWLGYEVSPSNVSAGRMGPSTVAAVRACQEKP